MRTILDLPVSKRVYGLDVLRAFAILGVLFTHAVIYVPVAYQPLYNYLVYDGVTIFFVLSGFLIGGILLRELESQPVSWALLRDFWVKRWVRTIPPYLLVLLLLCLLTSLNYTAFKSEFEARYVWRFFFFAQNFKNPQVRFFPEAWSLSVEEWFYLLVPPAICLLVAARVRAKQAVPAVALLVFSLVTGYRLYNYLHFPPTNLVEWDQHFRKIVIMRLDSLMVGVLGAYWARHFRQSWNWHAKAKLIIGLSLIVLHQLFWEGGIGLYASVFSFTLLSGATLLVLPAATQLSTGSGPVYRALTHISLTSYSMYLLNASVLNIHVIEPTLAALHYPSTSWQYQVLGGASFWVLTIILATLMYKYVELPVLAWRNQLTQRKPVQVAQVA